MTGAAAFAGLHEHSYRNEVLVGELRRTHLARSAELVRTTRAIDDTLAWLATRNAAGLIVTADGAAHSTTTWEDYR